MENFDKIYSLAHNRVLPIDLYPQFKDSIDFKCIQNMRLGEKSAFFIKSDHSQNFCQSPVMKDLCYCPKVFEEQFRKKKTCLCGKDVFFQVGLFVIIDEESQQLALRLQDSFNTNQFNGKKRGVVHKHPIWNAVRPELQISQKYVSNQLGIAHQYIEQDLYDVAEYIYNRLI